MRSGRVETVKTIGDQLETSPHLEVVFDRLKDVFPFVGLPAILPNDRAQSLLRASCKV
ncbi:MAG: hypothetical protein QXU73_05335 [Thermoplasmata archaeon]